MSSTVSTTTIKNKLNSLIIMMSRWKSRIMFGTAIPAKLLDYFSYKTYMLFIKLFLLNKKCFMNVKQAICY